MAAQAAAFGEGLAALLPQLQALTDILPPPTLAWKLQLLEEGNKCASVWSRCDGTGSDLRMC